MYENKNENENEIIRFNFNNGYLYVKEDINSLLNSKVKNTQFQKKIIIMILKLI